MRMKVILGVAAALITGAAFLAGMLAERHVFVRMASGPVPPSLVSPARGAILPNGDLAKGTLSQWEFTWSDVPGAERHQLIV